MIKSFKYRLYPNKEQEQTLLWTLDRCREVYNAALQERREAYLQVKRHPNYYDNEWRKQATKEYAISRYDQYAELAGIREAHSELYTIPIVVLRDPLQRVDLAMKAFFRRVKAGQTPGYPRFKGYGRYDSFTYVQAKCFTLTHDNRLCLSKIGTIKAKLHRPIEGKIKTCTIKREGEQWYVVFVCEVAQPDPLPVTDSQVGIDLGITHFAALSDGTFIDNPRHYRRAEKKLQKHQQALSRKKKGSHRRDKARKLVAKAHRKVARQRTDFLHKESHKLVQEHDMVVFEDLRTANMVRRPKPKQDAGQYLPNGASAKSGLNKSINDAGWGQFVQYVTYKAANAGREVLFVNPKGTSQMCSGCGETVKKELSERWHSCECGTELDRDHNAAINILERGQRSRPRAVKIILNAIRH